jgi:hypothetical protein
MLLQKCYTCVGWFSRFSLQLTLRRKEREQNKTDTICTTKLMSAFFPNVINYSALKATKYFLCVWELTKIENSMGS